MPINNCYKNTEVNIQLLSYIIRLLNISKEDLLKMKCSFNNTNYSNNNAFRKNSPQHKKCIQLSDSKMMSSFFQNNSK